MAPAKAEMVLNNFAEFMSKLMTEQSQQHLTELSLTLSQAHVLRILKRGSRQTGQLAEELKISAPAMTQLTDRLLRKGLIERRSAEDDRRCVIVTLSARGAWFIEQFRERRREVFNGALSRLSNREQQEIGQALEKVLIALEGYQTDTANGGLFSSHLIEKGSSQKKLARGLGNEKLGE